MAPLRGSAERSEAPKGELDSPLEVPRLCERLEQETYETGHWFDKGLSLIYISDERKESREQGHENSTDFLKVHSGKGGLA